MKKSNVILQAAIASALLAMAGSASAATSFTASITPKFAVEVFKGSAAYTPVNLGNVTVVSSVSVPATSNVTVALQLANGATFNTGVTPTIAVNGGAKGATVTYVNSGGATLVNTTATAASNADVMLVDITSNTALVGVGANLVTIGATGKGGAGMISAHLAGLATAGSVTATTTVYTGLLTAMPAAGTVPYDATSAATTVASSTQGITLAAAATAAGTQKIDLTATPVSTKLTTAATTVANLGNVTATLNTAVSGTGASATLYSLATKMLTATVTAPAGFFSAMGTTKKMWLESAGCTAAGAAGVLAGTPSAVFTTTGAAGAATTVTLLSTAVPVTATAYNVCMEVDGSTTIVPGTASVALSLGAAAAQDSAQTLAATPLMTLALNGAQVDVRNYVPAALAGWTQYLRIINTGTVAATVSAQAISDTTGLPVGTAAPIITNMKPGVATTLNSTQIEAAIGAQAAASRPRIRITAPTNGMDVQNFVFSPNGSFTAAQGTDK